MRIYRTGPWRAAGVAVLALVAQNSGCAIEDTGTSVNVSYRTTGLPSSLYADGSVCVYAIDLLPCDGSVAQVGAPAHRSLAFSIPDVSEWVLPAAHAHSEGAANRFNTPVLLRVKQDEHTSIDAMNPAPGRYCSVRLLFAPADPDAQRLVINPAMLGRTLTASIATLSDPVVMDVVSTEELEVEVPLAQPLLLQERDLVQIDVEMNLSRTLLAVHRMQKHGPAVGDTPLLSEVPPGVVVTFTR